LDTEPAGLTRMPIRDILWSNPEWFRVSLGDVQSLIQSIKEQGLQVPILVTEDLLVLDGARRITAYTSMGRKEIPVVVTNDWDRVIGHLEHTRAMEASGLPFEYMSWEELDAQWRLGIVPLYGPEKVARMAKTVAAKKKGRKLQPRPRRGDVAVNGALGQAFAMEPAAVKALRDAFAALRNIEEKHQLTDDQKKAFRMLIRQVEEKSPDGKFVGVYGLRNLLREFTKGEIPVDEVINVVDSRELARRRVRDQVRVWERNRRNNPATDSEIIANFCRVITQFGEEAQRFQSFEPSLIAEPLISQLRTAVNRFNALRRRLESGATTEGEQDS
jgi:hypothetical protein